MNIRVLSSGLAAVLSGALAGTAIAQEDVLSSLRDDGVLTVGVKVDYRPFGFREDDGNAVGLEHDLVADLSEQLGEQLGRSITVEKVTVTAQNRIPFLQQGRIDLLIATMNESPERRQQVDIIDPGYYASGATIVARKELGVEKWEDLTGKEVCTMQGAFYNRDLAQEYDINLTPYAGVSEMNQAVLGDRCFAQINDSVLADLQLQNDETWGEYEMPVEPKYVTPFVMAISNGQPELHAMLEEIAEGWHRDGTIIELEEKWGIGPIRWLEEKQTEFSAE